MTVVAIDGPAGAGKSTIARAVARSLGWDHLDTGAMYRAVALTARERGLDASDGDALGAITAELDLRIDGERVWIGAREVSTAIRTPDVTALVSRVSAHPQVRTALVRLQRQLAAGRKVVIEGRDIGTAVFPDAAVKVFLTASLAERARRRALDLGETVPSERLIEEISSRDEADASRAESPLRRAADAVEIDSTDRSIAEVTDEIVKLAREATDE